jgi:hypothetical protein
VDFGKKYGVIINYKSDFKGNYILSAAIESNNCSIPLEIDGGGGIMFLMLTRLLKILLLKLGKKFGNIQ